MISGNPPKAISFHFTYEFNNIKDQKRSFVLLKIAVLSTMTYSVQWSLSKADTMCTKKNSFRWNFYKMVDRTSVHYS